MAYDSAADLAQIQKDVLTTDVSGNTLINKANQLKTDAKRITKAINELKSQLDRSLEKGDTAIQQVNDMKTGVTDIIKEQIKTVVSEGIQNDEFACENNQTVFSLTKTPADKNNILFYINGIKYPKTDYCYHEDSNTIEWLNIIKNDQHPNAFSLKDTDNVSAIYMS